jgi:putative acetyltransferase
MMHCVLDRSKQKEIEQLFTSVFTSSEGEEEGKLIGALSSQLASNIEHRTSIIMKSSVLLYLKKKY